MKSSRKKIKWAFLLVFSALFLYLVYPTQEASAAVCDDNTFVGTVTLNASPVDGAQVVLDNLSTTTSSLIATTSGGGQYIIETNSMDACASPGDDIRLVASFGGFEFSTTTSYALQATTTIDLPIVSSYDIISSTSGNGTIDPLGTTTVAFGGDQIYTISPDTGYHIVDVLVDASSTGPVSSYEFTNVTTAHTITAVFAIDTFDIVSSVTGSGSINPSGTTTLNYGDDQIYTITADTGYHIFDVLVDGSSVGATSTYEFTNVTATHTISAIFEINTYDIVATASANGTITPTGTTTLEYGTTQTYTMNPDEGYIVDDVLVDGSSFGPLASYYFRDIDSDHTIEVSFIPVPAGTFTIVSDASIGGTVSPLGYISVATGTDQSFTIASELGYHLSDLLIDGSSIGATSTYEFTNVLADHTIYAVFAIDTFDIVSSAGTGGTIVPLGVTSVEYGANQSYDISPDSGYAISDVLVDGSSVGTLSIYEFINVTATHTIMAMFASTTDVTPPSIPQNLSASASSRREINLSWSASTDNIGVVGYEIFRDGATNPIASVDTNSYSDTGLSSGVRYYYSVRAFDAAGNRSDLSDTVSATTRRSSSGGGGGGILFINTDTTAPAPPRNISIEYASGPGYVLRWTNPSDDDFVGVRVLRRSENNPQGANDGILLFENFANQFTDRTALPNSKYYYGLMSYDSSGNLSQIVTVNTDQVGQGVIVLGDDYYVYEQYKNLYGLPSDMVNNISLAEAQLIMISSPTINLTSTNQNLFDNLIRLDENLSTVNRNILAKFIQEGSPTTKRLGAGERAGIVHSFERVYGSLPNSIDDYQEVIKIANGRWTKFRNVGLENEMKESFRRVYKRDYEATRNLDQNALQIMTYGLRPVNRDMGKELRAINIFEGIFGRKPSSSKDWDINRAIAYSGATR